jgi:hypothetical protein
MRPIKHPTTTTMVGKKRRRGKRTGRGRGVLHETLASYKLACIFHMPQNVVEI